jgi:uncharacterized protein (DUF2147 family)
MTRLLLFLVCSFTLSATTYTADSLTGTWMSADKDGKIKIYGSGSKYYGMLIWLKEPIDPETGKPKLDKKNSDKTKRSRPIMNLEIMKDLVWDADDQKWSDGEIYDPKTGNTYSLTCKLKTIDQMELTGYMGITLLGRTTSWDRVK